MTNPKEKGLREEIEKILDEYTGHAEGVTFQYYRYADETLDAILTLFTRLIAEAKPGKRIMANPVPDSDEVVGYNIGVSDYHHALMEKVGKI